ncbi:MAG: alpha/beta hydrolase family esterase [Betaproteobacteria bacterium]
MTAGRLLKGATTLALGAAVGFAGTLNAQAPVPGEQRHTIRVTGLDRHYTIHVPANAEAKSPLPVVVMLHGGGGTGKGAARETGWAEKADEAGFLAVFPDAMPSDPSRPSQFRLNPQLWNDGSDRFYRGQKAPDDVAFLEAMLDDLAARHRVDPRQIYVTGFSNGASMSFRVGVALAHRIAAIAPVAGALWLEPPALKHPVPMLYITGTADPLNIIEGGIPKLVNGAYDPVRAKAKPPVRDSIGKWARALGVPVTPSSTTDLDGVRTEIHGAGAEVVYVAIEGLGHHWPGGRSLLPESMVGTWSGKVRATDLVWDFFVKHPRRD